MGDFPTSFIAPPGGTIHSSGISGLADLQWFRHTGTTTSHTWTTANRAIYVPFTLETTVTAFQMAVENGATVAGNVDVGIYDVLGNKIVTKGSTAQAGVSVMQLFDITDAVLTPGNYFMAMATDSTTATYIATGALNGAGEFFRAFGIQEQLTAFALPATATFANPATTTTQMPNIAIATRAAI